jgi:GNAT superfamily N-acetyltransferase
MPIVAKFCQRHEFGPMKPGWLNWKYLQNPDGRARVFIAEDCDRNIVGIQAFMPRRARSRSTGAFLLVQPVDVYVAPEGRGKGIFSELVSFCRINLKPPRISFPNEASMSIGGKDVHDTGKRHRVVGKMEDWLFPIEISGKLADTRYGFFSPLADKLSGLYALIFLGNHPKHLVLQPITRFSRDYEVDTDSIHGIRSAAFLNWRFVDNPMESFSCYEIVEGKESIGFCVFTLSESKVRIFDFVACRKPRRCLRLLVEHCRENGYSHLSFRGVGLRLRRFGFFRRGFKGYLTTMNAPSGSWYATLADKD